MQCLNACGSNADIPFAHPRHHGLVIIRNAFVYLQREDAAGCLWLRRQDMQLPCVGRRRSPHRPRLLQDCCRWDALPLQIQLQAPCGVVAHAVWHAWPCSHVRGCNRWSVLNLVSVPDTSRAADSSALAASPMGFV